MDKFREVLTNDIILGRKKSEEEIKNFLDLQAMKNWAYYTNNYIKILEFLNAELAKIVKNTIALQRMPRIVINDVPKLVRRTCLLYQSQPERTYSKEASSEQSKVLNKSYKHYKEIHRLGRTLNTVLVRPIWNEKTKQFDYVKLGRNFATAITSEDNQFDLLELIYGREVTLQGEKESQIVYFHWDEDNVWITDEDGEEINIKRVLGEKATNDNPYKRIPFSVLRLKESDDFWGDGLSTYVNLTEQNNLKNMDAYYKQWLSFGYPLGVNLDIVANEFSVAPYEPIMINNARQDLVTPSLDFVTPDHQVQQDRELVDWLRKSGGTAEGMSASSFSNEESSMSGYAKTIDNLEMLEMNNDDIEPLKEFEMDLFEMMKKESEVAKGVSFEGITLDSIEFKKYEFPKTTEEIWTEREYNYKYNMESEVDWLINKKPGLTEDEAKDILKNNRKIKIQLGQGRPTLFEQANQE